MKNKICGVYQITNVFNNKIYIGSSNDIHHRWYQHRRDLDNNRHENQHLQDAWNIYGAESFKFSILEECEPNIQFEREQHYLNMLKPFDDAGYNIIRKISSDYYSDNCMTVKCSRCGRSFQTFSHLAKICDKCKEDDAKWWHEFEKHVYVSQKNEERVFANMMADMYGNYHYYCETEID